MIDKNLNLTDRSFEFREPMAGESIKDYASAYDDAKCRFYGADPKAVREQTAREFFRGILGGGEG